MQGIEKAVLLMLQLWYYALILVVVALAAAGCILLLRASITGSRAGSLFFKDRTEPRLAVVEHALIDGKRRLVLIRRDNVEHLIMTGGPVDVLIESSIAPRSTAPAPLTAVASPAIEPSPVPRPGKILGI